MIVHEVVLPKEGDEGDEGDDKNEEHRGDDAGEGEYGGQDDQEANGTQAENQPMPQP